MRSDSVTFTFVVLSFTRLVRKVTSHFEYLGNRSRGRTVRMGLNAITVTRVSWNCIPFGSKECYGKVCEPRHEVCRLWPFLPLPPNSF